MTQCAACGAENPATNKFCGECGAALPRTCGACGVQNPPTNRFCGECGARLDAATTPSSRATSVATPQSYTPKHLAEKILASRAGLEGERKQVTVLFADVVGSTELVRDLDPEDAQRLLDGAVTRMMDAVHRYEGTVSRSMGDGIMALFGAPLAHEDHAVRACYAALALHEAMRGYAEDVRREHGIRVQARVGLNSGEVVVRLISDDLHMDYTALGSTVHLASRMEQLANPGGAALTAATLSLAEGYIQVRSLGPVRVKGLEEPVQAYELVGAGALRTRLQVSAARGLTKFVGRQAELEALHGALDRAREGRGQIAALVGEPGVGKSRLVWEVTHSHRTEGWTILESGSVSYGRATSYLPVIDLLKRYCRIEPSDDARAIREKLLGKLLNLDEGLRPMLPPLLSLLDVAVDDPAWEKLEPTQRRQRTVDAIKRLLLRESQEPAAGGLLLVFEDLHWIDSETQAVLDSLVESLPTACILLLVNYRPEYTHSWGNRGYYTQLRIDPLGQESAGELLASLLGEHSSVQSLAPLLIERTQGNPFFLEESVRMLAEQEALTGERGAYRLVRNAASIRVPPTVQAILASRIDRLPPEQKRLLQTAAVVGKDVPLAPLRAIAGLTDDELQRGLAQLQLGEFLYEASLFPEPEYTFKHALTHEVTYGSLLQERRRVLHAQLLSAIEQLYAGRLDEHVEQLAHHALRGEAWEEAARYCQESAERASRRSAYDVAMDRYEQAVSALKRLSETRERLVRLFDLQMGLRSALGAQSQFERAIECGRELIETATKLDDQARLGRAFVATTWQLIMLGRHAEAVDNLERALAIAEARGDELLTILVPEHLGAEFWITGKFRRGIEVLSTTVARLDPGTSFLEYQRAGTNTYPPGMSRAFLANCLAEVGQFDEAIDLGLEAVRLTEATEHATSICWNIRWTCFVFLERGDWQRAIATIDRVDLTSLPAGSEVANSLMVTVALAHGMAGHIDRATRVLDEWLAARSYEVGNVLVVVIEACLRIGRIQDADRLARSALDLVRERQERGHEARVLWLLGEIVAQRESPGDEEAETNYRAGLALAEKLEMRPLQARCHLGLGKLLQRLDRRDEARSELSLAVEMLRSMGMAYWLPEAQTALAEVAR